MYFFIKIRLINFFIDNYIFHFFLFSYNIMKLKLVNPLLIGQFNTTYNVDKPLEAAVNFWNDLSTHLTNNMPSMRISFMDNKKELYHFIIEERLHGGSKSVNFTVKEQKYAMSEKAKNQFINSVENEEKKILNKAQKQSGGKMKNAPNKKNYEISSSSSSNSSNSSDSSDSSNEDEGELYDFSKYRRLSQPIIYYSYTPFIYKITQFYTPTFVIPLTPYIRTWIPNP
jgi:hypothetical protein